MYLCTRLLLLIQGPMIYSKSGFSPETLFMSVTWRTIVWYFSLSFSWPVRTLSFSHDGGMLASGSEDLIIDIVRVFKDQLIF